MTNTAPTPSAIHKNVIPSEVGWQFVPQYYTFVNKQPERLHCFYTKRSTFIHGTEGEDGKPCHGQQEIHAKITSLNFQDCKVFIHSVDAQASAEGGIIIQVIGEMSNRGDEWRKFVQTFFLAEQPNGYFVLNDIFRFLKEESVDGDDEGAEEAAPNAVPSAAEPTPTPPTQTIDIPTPAPIPEPYREPTPAPAPAPVPEPIREEPTTVAELVEPEPPTAAAPSLNGYHTPEPVPAPAAVPEVQKAPTPARSPAPPPVATPPPAPAAQTAPQQTAPPAQPAQQPQQRKTWANLAASNHKKWGSNAASTATALSTAPPPTGTSTSTAPSSGANTPTTSAPPQQQQAQQNRPQHPAYLAAQSLQNAQIFIKHVPASLPQPLLNSVLTSKFGALKELEIVRNKGCAFGEFTNIESAKKAVIGSLNQAIGGEGGVFIDVETESGGKERVRVVVESKKERADRPPPPQGQPGQQGQGNRPRVDSQGPRGGGPQGGGSGFRGRGRGRGGAPQQQQQQQQAQQGGK